MNIIRALINQKGAVQTISVFLIIAVIGIVTFLVVSSLAPFNKDSLFDKFFQKPPSKAATLTDWSQLQHDSQHSGYQPNMRIRTNTHTSSGGYGNPTWVWTSSDKLLTGQLVSAEGIVAIGSKSQKVYALDQSTGSLKWSVDVGGMVLGTLAISGGKVIVPTYKGDLIALSVTNGGVTWTYKGAAKGYYTSPVLSSDTIYIGSEDGKFHAVDLNSGSARWVFQVGGSTDSGYIKSPIVTAAALLNGNVYFGAENMYVYALNAQSGSVVWRRQVRGQSFVSGWVVASSQNNGIILVRTQPIYSFHTMTLNSDDSFLESVTGTTNQGNLTNNPLGTLTDWIKEQKAISERLLSNPYRRSLWELDASTGQDKYSVPMPIIYTGGSGNTAVPPVIDDINNRAWTMLRTVYSRFDGVGVRMYGELAKLNLNFNPSVYTNSALGEAALGFQYFPCNGTSTCKIVYEDFHKLGDEQEVLTATQNAIVTSNWVSDGGIDLESGSTFNIKRYSDCDANCAADTVYGTGAGVIFANNKVFTRDSEGVKCYAP